MSSIHIISHLLNYHHNSFQTYNPLLLILLLLLHSTPCTSSMSCPTATTLPLPNGALPTVGLGCWKLSDPENIVGKAIERGWRHIDSACDYGNEVEVGRGIKKGKKEEEGTRREANMTRMCLVSKTFYSNSIASLVASA